MKTVLTGQIAALAKSPKLALLEQFAKTFGAKPTGRSSRELLALMLAHRLQERAFGGLSVTTRNRLVRLAQGSKGAGELGPSRRLRIKPGTRLVRMWHGDAHTVEVTERGYEYDGKRYANLSEIARLITGARWSGPKFFGLKTGQNDEAR